MTATVAESTSVRRSITVKASADRAFQVFTEGIDTWWPRTHHIGKSPMKKVILESFEGGRAYSEQEDGTDCPWGKVMAWEPPKRFVLAWLIDAQWQYQPNPALASEVEVVFTPQADGSTRVDLEHRNFERMGPSGTNMRMSIDSPGGWNLVLSLYSEAANQ